MTELRKSMILLFLLAGCGSSPEGQPLAVHGDSTAIGSRIAWHEKFWNAMPMRDGTRWFNQLGRSVFNDGVGGQSIATMRDKMLADKEHRSTPTVIYDRVNTGETSAMYVEALSAGVATLKTRCFLIMPQVRNAEGQWDGLSRTVMPSIDAEVRRRWPNNTFTEAETRALNVELAPQGTRADKLHRNATGQAIEARYIGAWLKHRGC